MLVRGLDVVDIGADGVVPVGCSYSRKSKKALFNTNPGGGRFGFGHERYALVCMVAGAAAAAPGADSPTTPLDGPPTVSEGADTSTRALSFVPSGGWGNQVVGLQHALFFAKAIHRTLLVRVMDHYDVEESVEQHDMPGGAADERDVRAQLSIYQAVAPYRPLVTSFLDSGAFNVPAAVDSRLAACEVGAGADAGLHGESACINDVYMTGQEDAQRGEAAKTTTIIASKLSRYEDGC